MPEPCCAHTKPDGTPCAARPLPDHPFCLFHDPDHAEAQTEARRKGGAAPRRRIRRFPRLLDYQHVAELLSELFITSLNDPAAIDCRRLQALTTLARTLLKAVGTPTDTYMEHDDRVEPTPAADHLLRIYPPLPPDVEALLAAEPAAAEPTLPPPAAEPAPAPAAAPTSAAVSATIPAAVPDPAHSTNPAAAPDTPASSNPRLPIAFSPSSDPSDAPDPSNPSDPAADPPVAPPAEQAPEQAPNRCGTGASAMSTPDDQPPSTQNPPSDIAPTAAPIASLPATAPSPSADEALPQPEPRHILVDPHAPWPAADAARPTHGYVLVDLPFAPTRWHTR